MLIAGLCGDVLVSLSRQNWPSFRRLNRGSRVLLWRAHNAPQRGNECLVLSRR